MSKLRPHQDQTARSEPVGGENLDDHNIRVQLRKKVKQSFNVEELKTLCFDLDIDYEDLVWETHHGFARELVLYCDRSNQIPLLVSEILKKRPSIDLPPFSAASGREVLFDVPNGSVPHFVDHGGYVEQLTKKLEDVNKSPVFVCGMPGVGKSTVVFKYAQIAEKQGLYTGGIFGIDASAGVATELERLDHKLNESRLSEIKSRQRMLGILQRRPDILLIVDNISSPEDIDVAQPPLSAPLSELPCQLLCLSRAAPLQGDNLEVKPIESLDNAVSFMIASTGGEINIEGKVEKEAARTISGKVGGLPMALAVAAALANAYSRLESPFPFKEALNKITSSEQALEAIEKELKKWHRRSLPSPYSLAATLEAAYTELPPALQDVLQDIGLFKPGQPIKFQLLALASGEDDSNSMFNLKRALWLLKERALLEWRTGSDIIRVHRLVHEFINMRVGEPKEGRARVESKWSNAVKSSSRSYEHAFTVGEMLLAPPWSLDEELKVKEETLNTLRELSLCQQQPVALRRKAVLLLLQLKEFVFSSGQSPEDLLTQVELVISFLGSNQARDQLILTLGEIPHDFLDEWPHHHAQKLIYLAHLQREYRRTEGATEPLSITADEAQQMIDRAIDLIERFPTDYEDAERLAARIYLARANISAKVYEESGEAVAFNDAISYFERAQEAALAYDADRYMLAMIYREMCNIYTESNDFAAAEDALNEGFDCLNASAQNAHNPKDDPALFARAKTMLMSQQHLLSYYRGEQFRENMQNDAACNAWQQAIDGARAENSFLDEWLSRSAFKVEALINLGDYLSASAELCDGANTSLEEARQLWEKARDLASEIGSFDDWRFEIENRLSPDPPIGIQRDV